MPDFVDDEHCTLCSRMWRSEREAFRANLDRAAPQRASLQRLGDDASLAAFDKRRLEARAT